jgi:Na+-driven multidrug efflux pump
VPATMTEALPRTPPTRTLTLELLALSYLLLMTNLIWLIGTTDTIFMGQLGTATLAAVGLGNIMFWTLFLLPRGIVSAVIVLVSQRHGASDSVQV